MPTFLFFKNGKEIDRLTGANPDKLKSVILSNGGGKFNVFESTQGNTLGSTIMEKDDLFREFEDKDPTKSDKVEKPKTKV
jgi:hypothetical protein